MLSVILHKDSTIDRLRKILTQEIHALRKIFYKKIRLCAKSELFVVLLGWLLLELDVGH